MSTDINYPIKKSIAEGAHVSESEYASMYRHSIEQPEEFWSDQARKYLSWFSDWDETMSYNFHTGEIRWFDGATINASYNCLDRHLATRGDQVAVIWEADRPGEGRKITYQQLYEEVCRFANLLKSRGVQKGDRVAIYMPMIPEAIVATVSYTHLTLPTIYSV